MRNSKAWIGLGLVLGVAGCSTAADEPASTVPENSTTVTVPSAPTTTSPATTTTSASATSTTTMIALVDPPPTGDAYAAAIGAACGELCPDTGAWIAISPNHSDYEAARDAISKAYPDTRIVDPNTADGYPLTGNVLNIARVDDRSDPLVMTLRLAFDIDRRTPLPCIDVFLTVDNSGSWQPASPADTSVADPVASEYQNAECAQQWTDS